MALRWHCSSAVGWYWADAVPVLHWCYIGAGLVLRTGAALVMLIGTAPGMHWYCSGAMLVWHLYNTRTLPVLHRHFTGTVQ